MLEVAPRILFTPEGVLEIRQTPDNHPSTVVDDAKEFLDNHDGVSVSDAEETIIQVDPFAAIPNVLDAHSITELVSKLSLFTYFDYRDPRDGVFSAALWGSGGANGIVFPQIQKWFNTVGLNEDVARRCLLALASPYGETVTRKVNKEFDFKTDGANVCASVGGSASRIMSYSVVLSRRPFTLSYSQETEENFEQKTGKVFWRSPLVTTVGSCACWGVDGDELSSGVHITHPTEMGPRLYEMKSHNVDGSLASLSLLAGMGVLAHAASEIEPCEGIDDLLTDVEWVKTRHYDKETRLPQED